MPVTYLFDYTEVEKMTVRDFAETLMKTPGLPLSELRLRDLVYHGDKRIEPAAGVYFFKTDQEILYVGKCEKKSFVERIPDQLDGRRGAQFNVFPKLLVSEDKLNLQAKIDATIIEAVDYAFANASLVLIHFQDVGQIPAFEKLVRMVNLTLGEGRGVVRALNGYKTRTLDEAQYHLPVSECVLEVV